MRTFHSNCLIVALKEKLKDWRNIRLVPIWHGFHFHMMWFDIRENTYRHFTHRLLPGGFTSLWFRGSVEKVKPEHLKRWCRGVGIELKA